jgi:hypothetical protein
MTTATATAAAIAALAVAVLATSDAPAQTRADRSAERSPLTAYAQSRPRTRIRVSPRCFYRTQSTNFPVPYDCEAPGPGFVRECNAELVPEYRPSGTVIVPRMQCWWVRGY